MVNYHMHENGWAVILDDFDFRTATREDADTISYLVSKHSLVISKNQELNNLLTPEDEQRFCGMIGKLDNYDYLKIGSPDAYESIVDQKNNFIAKVTGEIVEKTGKPGFFGTPGVLDWHCNRPQDKGKKTVVWLRTIKGALGSRTSWSNHVAAWKDLQIEEPEFANYLKEKRFKIVCGGGENISDYFKMMSAKMVYKEDTARDLLFTNESGQESIFIPRLQVGYILGMTMEESAPILDKLYEYCLQEKYVYHHDWADSGEIVLFCNWSGLHKRWPFNGIQTRYLHRIAVDYTNTMWYNKLPTKTKMHFAKL